MTYVTVFDIAAAQFGFWWLAVLPPVVLAFALVGSRFAANPIRRKFAVAVGVTVAVGFAVAFAYGFAEHETLSAARAAGQYQTVEGMVADFHEELDEEARFERFTVNGVAFEYSSNQLTSAFHYVARDGGPIRSGARVRVGHVHGKIVKLEIAAADVPDAEAREAYQRQPAGPGLTAEELRRSEPVLMLAMLILCARFWLSADIFVRFGHTFASFATGFPPSRSALAETIFRAFVVLGVGVSAAQLTWNLLTVSHPWSDYQAAVAPLIFFTITIALFEGFVRWIVRRGGRYAPSW